MGSPLEGEQLRITVQRDVSIERHFREIRHLSTDLRTHLMEGPRIPFIVLWLIVGAVFFTLRMGFINIRAFRHAIDVVRGRFDDPSDKGEVSHFQALASALSATVGLGNIAGVAIAIAIGGPGAVFWMLFAAFFGMTSKFVECTLGQKYRSVDERGKVLGGPMMYLHFGLRERGLGGLGRVLAVLFMIFCIGGSFGGGNMFQANQAYQAMDGILPFHLSPTLFGLVLIVAVGTVILGGIRRIGRAAAAIVPLMCAIYLVATAFVLIVNAHNVPYALAHIIGDAFTENALYGGVVGVIIIGFQRAAFSNEAGIGSAAIAHSAAKTSQPVREGVVALLEPFIDTMIVCLATGLVIVVSGILDTPDGAELASNGALLTSAAFGSAISWFPFLLAIAITLFAYSTMLAWSYYGERCWTGLFGNRSSTAYKILFLFFIWVGCVSNLGAVLDFSDLMILSMAFPNILGLFLLSGSVRKDLDSYMKNLRAGSFGTKGTSATTDERNEAPTHDA
ncbi:MAG: alanine:cation symporter family protein [Deltaproteobacteria bacterium]|nr:MAG: alanine:cation symporter family protein [Deltaproteobacteria bacterium]